MARELTMDEYGNWVSVATKEVVTEKPDFIPAKPQPKSKKSSPTKPHIDKTSPFNVVNFYYDADNDIWSISVLSVLQMMKA